MIIFEHGTHSKTSLTLIFVDLSVLELSVYPTRETHYNKLTIAGQNLLGTIKVCTSWTRNASLHITAAELLYVSYANNYNDMYTIVIVCRACSRGIQQ